MTEVPLGSAFSSNAEAVITKSLEIDERERRPEDFTLEGFYEIEQTAMQIREHAFKRVILIYTDYKNFWHLTGLQIALQFPDEMLRDSVQVYLALKARLKDMGYDNCSLFVLADTSYGRCPLSWPN
jgi:diphthamide biosynthesis protein 2